MGHDLISIDYTSLPTASYETELRLYVEHGIKPNEFLFALLCGNAMAAMSVAPSEGTKIGDWLIFLRRKLPAVLHGHESLVARWMSLHRNPDTHIQVPTFADFPFGQRTEPEPVKQAA
jgi:hypothetical protein